MKLLLSLLLFFSPLASFIPEQEVSVIASYCCVYTDASFEAEKLKDGKNDLLIYHNDIVKVLEEKNDFVKVQVNETVNGYIYKYYVTANSSQDVYPVFNASIRNNDTIIYDIDQKDSGFKAKAGDRIFLYAGFNDKKEFTPIQIVLEDGSLYNGLIKSSEINPDGISNLLIIGISIIAASVTIILSIVFIKKTKKHKKKKQKQLAK